MDFGSNLERFSLRWNNFNDNMKSGFHDLLRTEDFVDVTIAAEGKLIQAHKMVLSVCSPYFRNIFKANPCQHPVVFLKDVTHKELSGILQFMYLGEVSVQQEELGRFLKTAEALQIKGLTGENDCKESVRETVENHEIPVKNKRECNDHEKETYGVKKMKISSVSDGVKGNGHTSPVQKASETVPDEETHDLIVCKTEHTEVELSDDESDRVSLKDENVSEPFLQLAENFSDVRDEISDCINTSNSSGAPQDILSGMQGIANESFLMADGNKDIRFVMSPRMRPCLVFNDYLYIKDHVGVARPGQPKSIYWRCKDISCKARCIQTDFKFRLKRNTFHQHHPNMDPSYIPIQLERAYDVINLLNGPEN